MDEDSNTSAAPVSEEGAVTETPAEETQPVEEQTEKRVKKTKAGPKSHAATETKKAAPTKEGKPRLPHGKKYREVSAKVDGVKLYSLVEAVSLAKETSVGKFDAAVELHVRLGQEARGSFTYPHSTGKKIRVAVAGPEVFDELAKGKINFDALLATPQTMPQLAKFARLLGPRGLMPNPKSGTVTEDVEKAKAELEAGRTEYRSDAGRNVHLVIGRVSQSSEELATNAEVALTSLKSWGIRAITVATTMGPGIKVELPEA